MRREFEQLITSDKQPAESKTLKRLAQQERRLYGLGATTETIGPIIDVLNYFDAKEFSKTIPARDEFYKRLVTLTQGESVPLVVFNCLDFTWQENSESYPDAVILDDTSTAICEYFQDEITETVETLGRLSPLGTQAVDLCIVVPDSELLDTRVFPFSQTTSERISIAYKVKTELSDKLAGIVAENRNPVMLWSEYCNTYALPSPADYTAINAERLMNASVAGRENAKERNTYRSLNKQISDSADYFVNNGLPYSYVNSINFDEREQRTLWYCAMYMGEGQALADSNALSLNLEDLRVGKWFNIGSNDRLPIITPVNPNQYYAWRREQKFTALDR